MTGSDDDLDQALRGLAHRTSNTERVQTALDDLVLSMEDEQVRAAAERSRQGVMRSRTRKRWLTIAPAIALGLAVIVPVGATAVGSWTAHTGVFGGTGTEVDRSEWIGLDADDAPQVIVELYDDTLPLPAGASPSDVINPVAAMLATMGMVPEGESGHVGMQATTIKGLYERAARCLWYREWLDADLHEDSARRDAATAGILDAVHWPITVASDGGGVVARLQEQADGANTGDRREVVGAYGKCENFYGKVPG
jgi:hypothetical protein